MCTMTKWFAGLEIELQFKKVVFSFRQVKMRFKVNQYPYKMLAYSDQFC